MTMTVTQQIAYNLYKDDSGNPVVFSETQDILFSYITRRAYPRIHVMCHTRWGKSFTVGLAATTLGTTFPLKIAVVAGTKEKAKVIMNVINAHIFDNDYTKARFVPEKGENMNDIRRHRSKNHLTFDTGMVENGKTLLSEIFIGSAKDALGFGADVVIADEAALIPDNEWSLVTRMLGDNPHANWLIKIGNPFTRGHFLQSYHDPNYVKFRVDCYKSLAEGRISQQIIDENKPYPYFGVLYECKFPSSAEVDEQGYMYIFNDSDIVTAQNRQGQPGGERRLGVDIARGGRDFNVGVLRIGNYAEVLWKNHDDDLINVGNTVRDMAREHGVKPDNVFVDDSGVGGGVTDFLKNSDFRISPVKLGESASDPEYLNVRAEIYVGKDGLQPWIKQLGILKPHADWIELTKIRYKKNVQGKIKLESKDDMRKQGIKSPDVADALALTFAKPSKGVYHGVNTNLAKILGNGAPSPFGGVPSYPGIPS